MSLDRIELPRAVQARDERLEQIRRRAPCPFLLQQVLRGLQNYLLRSRSIPERRELVGSIYGNGTFVRKKLRNGPLPHQRGSFHELADLTLREPDRIAQGVLCREDLGLELRLERQCPLHGSDVLPVGVFDVHEHRCACIVGLDYAQFELGIQKFAGKAPAHTIDELVVEIRIAGELARDRRLLLTVLGDGLDQVLAAVARVPRGRTVMVCPGAAAAGIDRKDVLSLERRYHTTRERQFSGRQYRPSWLGPVRPATTCILPLSCGACDLA